MRVAMLVALGLASALFVFWPAIDLAVSGYFFDGTGFPLQQNRPVEALRLTLYGAEEAAAAVALILSLYTFWRGRTVLRLRTRDWLYAFGVFAVGPGLIVNGILKRFWGRARPFEVTEFGGTAQFSLPWQISDQCQANCSFVSGEMSGSVALAILLAMIGSANRAALGAGLYLLWLASAAALPLFTAWQRIGAGRHFLSDVVLAALLTGLLAAVLARLFYPAKPHASAVDFPPSTP